jgi:hypothetical protein
VVVKISAIHVDPVNTGYKRRIEGQDNVSSCLQGGAATLIISDLSDIKCPVHLLLEAILQI